MSKIPFIYETDAEYGTAQQRSPLVRRVLANNPSAFTYTGTGTFIIGTGEVAVIDPGPADPAHIDAILAALNAGEKITHIFITHTHLDHSPAAAPLRDKTGAQIWGLKLSATRTTNQPLEEDIDDGFAPDHTIKHGDIISHADWTLEALHTPGHLANHFCYALRQEKILFTGDHIMGWSTSVIVPPDGNMRDYMNSLELLLTRDDKIYMPTHGAAIESPQEFVRAYIAHRRAREAQIIERLRAGDNDIREMVATLYANVDKRLHPAAALSVLAHIEYLMEQGKVAAAENKSGLDAHYSLI